MYLDRSPELSGFLSIHKIQIDLENFTYFLTDNTIMKSTKNYIEEHFLSIQIDVENFPDQSGLQSRGLKSRSIWRVRGNPDRSGFGTRLIQ